MSKVIEDNEFFFTSITERKEQRKMKHTKNTLVLSALTDVVLVNKDYVAIKRHSQR